MRRTSFASLLLLAPATTIAATLGRRELSPANELSGGWTYSGCHVDSVATRALNSAFQGDGTSMSAQTCTSFCGARGYPIAGLEYSSECWCGTLLPSQVAFDPTTCNMPCSGDATQVCGGPDRLTVYSRSAFTRTNPDPTGWQSLGCYTDNVSARTLSDMHAGGDQMTVELCAAACSGSKYFGVEYAGECFCGDSILNGGTSTPNGCDMPCKGDTSEFCGGSNRLNLYQAIQSQPSPEPSPSPSPSPSPQPVCAPTIQTDGQINNGGFELGSTWTRSSSFNAISKEVYGLAYEGCYSELLSVTSAGPGSRRTTITSTVANTPGKTYTITFYLGRRSRLATSSTVVIMQLQGQPSSQSFQVCTGAACDLVGTGGTVWRKHQATFIFTPTETQPLSFTTIWAGATRTDGTDDVLIDGISIT